MNELEYSVFVEVESDVALDPDTVDAFVDAMVVYHGCCSFTLTTAPTVKYGSRFTVVAADLAAASSLAGTIFRAAQLAAKIAPGRIIEVGAQTMASLALEGRS